MTGAAPGIRADFSGRQGGFALDAAFTMAAQGVTALFGPSGCGKTTVLRCVAGLVRLYGGTRPCQLQVGGQIWQDDAANRFLPPHRRRLGYVFQEASLFPHLSVRRNLAFGQTRARRRGDPVLFPEQEVVDLLGLAPLLDRAPARLSGGEKQRVAMGRALLSQPELLLMDEPLSALDHSARDEILPYFEALHRTLPVPVLYVSHDIGEVARLADRLILMAGGRLQAAGPVADMLEDRMRTSDPVTRFEAGAVVTAVLTGYDSRFGLTRLDLDGQALSVPGRLLPAAGRAAAGLARGAPLRLRIRARDVTLAVTRPHGISIRNILAGRLARLTAEPDSPHAEAVITVGRQRLLARITREAAVALRLRPGMDIHALVKAVAFDPGTLGPPVPRTQDDARAGDT